MRTRALGPTGIDVSSIGLGGMPMSLSTRPAEDDSVRVIHAALDAGVNFIDTANVYCVDDDDIGHNEQLIARALRLWSGASDDVIIATKGGLERPQGAWTTNGHPEHLRAACEKSLSALGVEAITLYQLHAPDDDVPFEDSVGALKELADAGKILHVGLSNVNVDEIARASAIVPIVSVQNRCNVFDRRAFDDGVLAYCERHGMAFLPYSPVGGGRGKSQVATDPTLNQIGAGHGVSPFQVALAWLLAKSEAMIPIPGASKVANAIDSAGAASLVLSEADLAAIG